MMALAVQKAPALEVSGFGRADIQGHMVVVRSIFIPPQEVDAAHTAVTGDNLRITLEAFIRAGTTLAQWPVWWHSHCSMGVMPSPQDYTTLELLAEELPDLGWFAGIVTNTKGEYHGWIEITRPLPLSAEVDVVHDLEQVPKKLHTRVDEMMKQVKPTVYAPARRGIPNVTHHDMCTCTTCMANAQADIAEGQNEEELIREMRASGMFLGTRAGEDEV
jgi:hypothetical protein